MCVYEYGLRSTDEDPQIDDIVDVYLRKGSSSDKMREGNNRN